ncbi:calcium channel flower [Cimex lectularius]|uniref:Calcium channel flower n=1 Tax=Cimex lectularius TaxID=79782 RepID=A0A8I6SBD6_CIMLE|nr:calcium channel flower [Cimex lectularius]
MSFMEKVGSIMRRPGEDAVPKDEVPWWMKYGGRGLGTVGGGLAIFLGMFNCLGIITADISCVISGIWQMCAGFATLVIEAPCCCLFLDFVQSLSEFVDQRPYWNRAALYAGIALPPIFLCFNLSSLLGSGLIFGTGVIYGMMALGKKASMEDMKAAVQNDSQPQMSGGIRSNLVDGAAPMGHSSVIPPV